jgi:hypothetical protein
MPQEEPALIEEVKHRLARRYAEFAPEHVAAIVQDAHARFDRSRVRDFVPLLVERRAGEELSTLSKRLGTGAIGGLATDSENVDVRRLINGNGARWRAPGRWWSTLSNEST